MKLWKRQPQEPEGSCSSEGASGPAGKMEGGQELESVPLKGLGRFRFGQTPEEVHEALGAPLRRVGETDQFAGLMVDYGPDGCAEYAQSWHEIAITWEGRRLIGDERPEALAAELRDRGHEVREEHKDYYVDELGFGFTGGRLIESVWVYPKGYYDALLKES